MELSTLKPAYNRVSDYFGLWSMYEPAFAGLFSLITDMDLGEHVARRMLTDSAAVDNKKLAEILAEQERADSGPGYELTPGGIAVLSMSGTLMKAESSFGSSASSVALRRSIRSAARDPNVVAALMVIDSPGGTVAGTGDLARDWAELNKSKPTATYMEDLCASAAYWVGSQAGLVACNETCLVGSIGTYMAVQDTSERAQAMKVKVHVIKAGAHKGVGVPGTPITEEHLAAIQERVDGMNAHFLAGVARGRKMADDKVKALADGRVHVGQAAKEFGLVDAVQSLDETIRQLMEQAGRASVSSKKGSKMTETNLAPAAVVPGAATLDELTAHLVGADDSFLMKQLKGKVTLDQAKANWLAEMNSRLTARDNEIKELKAGAGAPPGVPPLGKSGEKGRDEGLTGSAVEQFNEALHTLTDAGMDRHAAIASIARTKAELHQAFLRQTNSKGKAQRLIAEKYE